MTTWSTALRPKDVLAVILGGGAGTRLFPLTKDRAKPAVPLGGKYRIVDIPISNCLNADLRRIFLLTQFNSSSLHRHVQDSYRFDSFSHGFVEILAAQQRTESESWYQGTADAVRQNLVHLGDYPHQLVLILSGDQLYRMNFRALLERHVASGAEVTVATTPVRPEAAHAFGIMGMAPDGRVVRFVEKPTDPAVLASLRVDWSRVEELEEPVDPDALPASMGIYVFDRDVLADALVGNEADFGKHVIPRIIETHRVHAFQYQGYWEDIGTIRSFYEANLDLCAPLPEVQLLRRDRADLHPRALSARHQDHQEPDRAIGHRRRLHHQRRADRALADRRPRPDRGGRHHPRLAHHGRRLLRDARPRAARGRPADRDRPGHHASSAPSWTRTPGSAIRCCISPEGKPPHFDGPNFYLRDGIVVDPQERGDLRAAPRSDRRRLMIPALSMSSAPFPSGSTLP